MSVFLAATSLAGQNGAFSPQHTNNWSIELYGVGTTLNGNDPLTFSLARGFLPNVSVDEMTIPFGNEEVHVAGRAHYGSGNIDIRDYIDKDCQQLLVNWYSLVYGGPKGNYGVVGQPAAYKRVADILLSAPDGTFVRNWHLQGVWPSSMNFGPLDMAANDQVMITMAVKYDRAQYMGRNLSLDSIVTGAAALAS